MDTPNVYTEILYFEFSTQWDMDSVIQELELRDFTRSAGWPLPTGKILADYYNVVSYPGLGEYTLEIKSGSAQYFDRKKCTLDQLVAMPIMY